METNVILDAAPFCLCLIIGAVPFRGSHQGYYAFVNRTSVLTWPPLRR